MTAAETQKIVVTNPRLEAWAEMPKQQSGSAQWRRISGDLEFEYFREVLEFLARCNRIQSRSSLEKTLHRLISMKDLLWPGAVHLVSGTTEDQQPIISTGCCWGFEDLKNFSSFLEDGESRWFGHDPSPRLESDGEIIRLWSDGELVPKENTFYVEFEREQYQSLVRELQRDTQEFINRLELWAESVQFEQPKALAAAFSRHLSM